MTIVMASEMTRPAYLTAREQGRLARAADSALAAMAGCSLCPRRCGVDRSAGETGVCEAGYMPRVSSYAPHFGEESPLVGRHGSGTVFFTHCNLGCRFCQNYDISHSAGGREISFDRLAQIFCDLQSMGCHNINLVSPTHYVPQIMKAVSIAAERGLSLPLVYNTGGYDDPATLKLLAGIVDIYMPDYKFTDAGTAGLYADAPDYPAVIQGALKEMFRQVGDLRLDDEGLAVRGLIVRHLVLPDGLAGTKAAMDFLAKQISPYTYVNIMDQYHPCGDIPRGSPLSRRITREEFRDALKSAAAAGLSRLDDRNRPKRFW